MAILSDNTPGSRGKADYEAQFVRFGVIDWNRPKRTRYNAIASLIPRRLRLT